MVLSEWNFFLIQNVLMIAIIIELKLPMKCNSNIIYILGIQFYVLILASCNNQSDVSPIIISSKVKAQERDTTFFEFGKTKKLATKALDSQLSRKVEKVKRVYKSNKAQKIGKIKIRSSTVVKAILDKPELCVSKLRCYKILDLDQFLNSIYEINYAKFQSDQEGSTIGLSSFSIEEIIFKTENDAELLLSFINHIRDIEYYWESIDKYRSYIFVESNKLYFVRRIRKGVHSTDFPNSIVNVIKN